MCSKRIASGLTFNVITFHQSKERYKVRTTKGGSLYENNNHTQKGVCADYDYKKAKEPLS